MKNIIRRAKEDDFEQIHNLLLQLHNIHVKARPDIYIDVDSIDKTMYDGDLKDISKINLVAEKNNKIVGVCLAEIKKTIANNVMKDRIIINIKDICVDVKERKKGIGKLLYDELIKIARLQKIDSVELMVWGFNKDAIKFYKKIGMDIKNLRFEKRIR